MKIWGLVLTLISGLFFLVGGLISLRVKDKDKLNNFSVALSFMVMLGLIFWDIIPDLEELFVHYSFKSKLMIIGGCGLLGFMLLKILDFFIPTHHHEHKDNEKNNKEHISHIHHIGILTIISLILHNVLEGFLVVGIFNNSIKAGILFALSVLLHNVPLGTHIFGAIDIKNNKILASMLSLSSFFGGLIFLVIGNISEIILGIIGGITLGMLIYIVLMELWQEVYTHKKKKETILGLLVGVIIILLSMVI